MRVRSRKHQFIRKYISVAVSAALAFFFVFLTVYSATTISNNIQTDGTLSVTGAATFNGAVIASSTLQVTNAVVLYDTVSFRTGIGASSTVSITGSTTVAGAFNVSGAASLASTLAVVSSTTVSGALNVGGVSRFASPIDASSTLAAGRSTLGTTSVSVAATSSPAQELSVLGDAYVGGGPGTTTLVIDGGSGSAGCIQLRAADGTMVRIYASSTPPGGDSGIFGRSNGTSLIVEAGMCKTGN